MIPALISLGRLYAPYLMFPVALVVGTIGYNIEWSIRDRNNPKGGHRQSVERERDERLLQQIEASDDLTNVGSLKEKAFISRTMFDKNLSPSLKPE